MNEFTKLAAVLSIAGVGVLSLGASRPERDATPTDKPAQTGSKQDVAFLDEAAMGGLLEVQLGQLGVKHGASEDVRKFGQRMVDHHTKLNRDIGKVAADRGLVMPQALDKKHREIVDKLAKETGAGFDRAYMSRMVEEHTADLKTFEKEAKEGQDPALKQIAMDALPVLRDHLAQAKEIQGRLKK